MEIKIAAKNLDISPILQQYIEKKIGRLSRYLPKITTSRVEIYKEKTKSPQERFVVEVTIDSKGKLLRGEERSEDLHAAIDKVTEVLERRIERYKGKLYEKGRGISMTRGEFVPETGGTQTPPRIIKVKSFPIKPMSPEEAAAQMELLGHDFFLFINADTNEPNLIYRRKDGNYGLIKSEPA